MPRRSDNPSTDNWLCLWELNKKSHRRRARAWLRQLSSSPSQLVAPTVPIPTFDSSDTGAMTSNPVIQSPENQFLHWRQDMEKKQEEQARQMRELQDCVEHLQWEKDHLRAQVKKRRDLGEKDTQDSSQAKHPTARNKGKESIVPDNIDTSADDKLSLGSSPDLSPTKNSRARLHQRRLHHPAFNNVNSGTFRHAIREIGQGQN